VAVDNAIVPVTANELPHSVVVMRSAAARIAAVRIAAVNAAVRLGPVNRARKTHAAPMKDELNNAKDAAKPVVKDGPKAEAETAEAETEVAVIAAATVVATVAVTVAVTAVDVAMAVAVPAIVAGRDLYHTAVVQ
jgi:hypothetical protein